MQINYESPLKGDKLIEKLNSALKTYSNMKKPVKFMTV